MSRNSIRYLGQSLSLDAYERLPQDDLYRDELVRGRLVREPLPGPGHARIGARLTSVLDAFVRRRDLGVVLAEAGFVLSTDPPTVRGPDISFVSKARIPAEGFDKGFWRMAPDLAIEIVSPSNTALGIREKVLEYLDAGARLAWVVHPRTRAVTVYRSRTDVRVLGEGEVVEGGDVLPGFSLVVAEVFGR